MGESYPVQLALQLEGRPDDRGELDLPGVDEIQELHRNAGHDARAPAGMALMEAGEGPGEQRALDGSNRPDRDSPGIARLSFPGTQLLVEPDQLLGATERLLALGVHASGTPAAV